MNANVPRDTTENTIDLALAALRDAQPRSGLNGRILASIEQRRAASPQPARLHLSAHVALWTAASAAVLAMASLLVLHHRAAPSRAPQVSTLRPGLGSPRLSAQRTLSTTRHPERSVASRRPPVLNNCTDHHNPGCPMHDDGSTVVMGGAPSSQTPTDAQALADLHAPSHPAPPLQLTTQEKLLFHLLRYGNAAQLAELNPLVRAQQDAAETDAFKAFFPDPPPLEQPGDTE